jgi:hypothetical protein
MGEVEELYLDLMKVCLTGIVWEDPAITFVPRHPLLRILRHLGVHVKPHSQRELKFNRQMRIEGRDWPKTATTMVGLKRLDNLQDCVEDVIRRRVPGDLFEAGVWRGGASILMRAVLKAHAVTDRVVWVADSFSGLPHPSPEKYPHDKGSLFHTIEFLSVPLEEVKANFAMFDLLDEQVQFLRGWFRETLAAAPINKLAVLRLDADMYESTMDVLTNLYTKVSVGGYVIVDDYLLIPGCKAAVDDFRKALSIQDEIEKIDWSAVFWRRSS